MTFREKTKDIEMCKKHNTNDIGYGTKVTALNDMGLSNTEFDLLNDEFNINDTEFDLLEDDIFSEDVDVDE